VKKLSNNYGFTLIEIIMSIIIITILGVIAGMGFVEIAKGYTLSKKNATVAQQGQITAARLKKELSSIRSITCGGANIITYKIKRSASEAEDVTSIYWAGGNNPIMLQTTSGCTVCTSSCVGGDKLADNVSDFTLSYCTTAANCSATFPNSPDLTAATVSLIKVTLKLKGYEDVPISIADPDVVILGMESGS
jgi:prepilin-type N-terminal cleavage/methylation domain-containing protein